MNKDDIFKEDADLKRIDQALSDIFEPPEGLEQRIMDAVKKRAPAWNAPRVSVWRNPLLRYGAAAAVFAVVAGALFLGVWKNSPSGNGGIMAEREKPQDLRLAKEFPQSDTAQKNVSRRMPLRLAGVSSSLVPTSGGERFHVGIPSVLRHVWIVPDLNKAEEYLSRIAQANKKKLQVLEKNPEQVIYSATLSDTEVQSLVNLLHKENWSLVSPGYPQPMEEYNALFTGKAVDYEMQIVRQQ